MLRDNVQIIGKGILTPVTSEEYHQLRFLAGAIEKNLGFTINVSQFTITSFSDEDCIKMIDLYLAHYLAEGKIQDPYKNGISFYLNKMTAWEREVYLNDELERILTLRKYLNTTD